MRRTTTWEEFHPISLPLMEAIMKLDGQSHELLQSYLAYHSEAMTSFDATLQVETVLSSLHLYARCFKLLSLARRARWQSARLSRQSRRLLRRLRRLEPSPG